MSVFLGRQSCERPAPEVTPPPQRSRGFVRVVRQKNMQGTVCFNHTVHIIVYYMLPASRLLLA